MGFTVNGQALLDSRSDTVMKKPGRDCVPPGACVCWLEPTQG